MIWPLTIPEWRAALTCGQVQMGYPPYRDARRYWRAQPGTVIALGTWSRWRRGVRIQEYRVKPEVSRGTSP